jgi:hypothetical protein
VGLKTILLVEDETSVMKLAASLRFSGALRSSRIDRRVVPRGHGAGVSVWEFLIALALDTPQRD